MNVIEEIKPHTHARNVDLDNEIGERSRFAAMLDAVRLLLIATWLGAAIFFGAAVAPNAFAVLAASRELAGAIVSRTLAAVNMSGFVISLLLLLSAPVLRRAERKAMFRAEMIALAIVGTATGFGQWIITARLEQLRGAMQRPIEMVAANDPLRITFGQWHVYSVIALGVAVLSAFAAFFLIALRKDKFLKEGRGNV